MNHNLFYTYQPYKSILNDEETKNPIKNKKKERERMIAFSIEIIISL